MLTKKHFIKFAKVVSLLKAPSSVAPEDMNDPYVRGFEEGYEAALDEMANELAAWFQSENKNFDRARFLEACKGEH